MGNSFQQAKAIHNDGRLDEAVIAYQELLQSDPDNFKAYNNLGTVYEEKHDYETAAASYRRALEINPEAAPVHYNLGHALQKQGQYEAAIDAYQAALALRPDHPDTHYNIGHAYHDLGELDAAETAYRKAIEGNPELYRAHSNLGTLLFDQSRMPEAADHYRRAIEINADSAADQFNLGRVWEVQGKHEDAVSAYRESLALNPLSAIAYERVAALENKLNRPDKAAEIIEQWLVLMPDNPVALHLRAAFNGDQTTTRASDDYVRATFDSFAPEFDRRLENLGYSAPQVIGRCLKELLGDPGNNLDILDAGCGTGLCGPHVQPYARRLTGVDISGAMLDKARERGGYDELVEAELTTFLSNNKNSYDLLISADVLVYFGDLRPVFEAAAKALRPNGYFVFTVEHLDDRESSSGYHLNPHGRYSHTEAYLRQALEQAGLVLLSSSIELLRTEGGQPVKELVIRVKARDSET